MLREYIKVTFIFLLVLYYFDEIAYYFLREIIKLFISKDLYFRRYFMF